MDARCYVVTAWEKEGIPAHRGGGLVSCTDAMGWLKISRVGGLRVSWQGAFATSSAGGSFRQRIQRLASCNRLAVGMVFECWRWGLMLPPVAGVLAAACWSWAWGMVFECSQCNNHATS